MPLAIIGGTGVEQMEGLEVVAEHLPQTPFGKPSGPVQEGNLDGTAVFFLQRHGGPAAIPPHRINYRANLWALRSLGARDIVAINAVGGINPAMEPGCLVIPDQLIDYTWGREHTVDEGGEAGLLHVDFTEPYNGRMRSLLMAAAEAEGIPHQAGAVHGVTQGPRLETAAEIRRLARDGCDVVGMTGMPEAGIARELGLAYASLCMVVNAAAGLGEVPISHEMMRDILKREAGAVRRLLAGLLTTRSR